MAITKIHLGTQAILDLQNQVLNKVGVGVLDTDAVNLGQVKRLAGSEKAKAIAVSNIAVLSVAPMSAFDGVTLVTDDIVLLAGQTNKIQNGLYKVAGLNGTDLVLQRPANYTKATLGAAVTITDGALYAFQTFVYAGYDTNNDNELVIDADQLEFIRQSGLGMVTAGNGVSITADDEISFSADPSGVLSSDPAGMNLSIIQYAIKHERTNLAPTGAIDGVNKVYALDAKAIKSTVKLMLNGQRIDGGIAADFTGHDEWDFRISPTLSEFEMRAAPLPAQGETPADKLRYDCLVTL